MVVVLATCRREAVRTPAVSTVARKGICRESAPSRLVRRRIVLASSATSGAMFLLRVQTPGKVHPVANLVGLPLPRRIWWPTLPKHQFKLSHLPLLAVALLLYYASLLRLRVRRRHLRRRLWELT